MSVYGFALLLQKNSVHVSTIKMITVQLENESNAFPYYWLNQKLPLVHKRI